DHGFDQAERGHHVVGVQGEIQHVADFVALLGVAVAGQQRSVDAKAFGQRIEQRVFGQQAAGAMEEQQVGALAAGQHLHIDLGGMDGFEADHWAPPLPSEPLRAATGPGVARWSSGLHQKRWSLSYSGHWLRSLGMTFSANSRVEYLVLSMGMSPTWM